MAKKNFKRQSSFQPDDEHYISKSQAKRDVEELQKLGGKLVKLSKSILESFELDEKLMDALLLAQNINSNSATRRQAQLIGKLMRECDSEKIRQKYERYQNQAVETNAHFHKLESYRDQLLSQGDSAINQLLNQRGVKTFIWEKDAPGGKRLDDIMSVNIKKHDKILFIASQYSINKPAPFPAFLQ